MTTPVLKATPADALATIDQLMGQLAEAEARATRAEAACHQLEVFLLVCHLREHAPVRKSSLRFIPANDPVTRCVHVRSKRLDHALLATITRPNPKGVFRVTHTSTQLFQTVNKIGLVVRLLREWEDSAWTVAHPFGDA